MSAGAGGHGTAVEYADYRHGGLAVVCLPDWREEHRYGVYTVRTCSVCGGNCVVLTREAVRRCTQCRHGRELVLLACADDPGGVGQAIISLGDDAHAAGAEPDAVGVLDGMARRWLAHPPWQVPAGHV